MASRKDAQKTNKKNHENVWRAIGITATPMIRYSRLFKSAMKKIPAQASTMKPDYDELLDHINRVKRIRKADLVDVDDFPTPIQDSIAVRRIQPTDDQLRRGFPPNEDIHFYWEVTTTDGGELKQFDVRSNPPGHYWDMHKGTRDGKIVVSAKNRFANLGDVQLELYLWDSVTRTEVNESFTIRAADAESITTPAPGTTESQPIQPPKRLGAPPPPKLRPSDFPRIGELKIAIPTEEAAARGIPQGTLHYWAVVIYPNDGQSIPRENFRLFSDIEGELRGPAEASNNGQATVCYIQLRFNLSGMHDVRVEVVDVSGKRYSAHREVKIIPVLTSAAGADVTDQLKEGEAPFTVAKFTAQKLGPAIDTLNGIYDGALKHAHRDIRFLVKWKRKIVRDFAVTNAIHKSVQRDASDGKIDKLKKYIKRLTKNLHAFEAFIRFFNSAVNEQRRLNHSLVQTHDAIVAIRNLTRQISVQPDEQVMEKISGKRMQTVHPLHNKFETVNVNITNSYVMIRRHLQEMNRRVQRMGGGIKNYKQGLVEMIGALSSGKAHDQIARTFDDRFKDLKDRAQKELSADVDGMVTLLRGVVGDIAEAQKQLDRLKRLNKELSKSIRVEGKRIEKEKKEMKRLPPNAGPSGPSSPSERMAPQGTWRSELGSQQQKGKSGDVPKGTWRG